MKGGLVVDRGRVSSHHSDCGIVEMSQEGLDRALLHQHVGADHDQHGGAGFADEDVDGRCLPFPPLLPDQAHAGVVAGELGHDLGGSILAATGHHDELRDCPEVSFWPRMLSMASAMLASSL